MRVAVHCCERGTSALQQPYSPMTLVEIAVFRAPFEAELARGALVAAGIGAVLFDAGVSGTYGGALGLAPVRLMVESGDERDARAFLAAAGD